MFLLSFSMAKKNFPLFFLKKNLLNLAAFLTSSVKPNCEEDVVFIAHIPSSVTVHFICSVASAKKMTSFQSAQTKKQQLEMKEEQKE